MGKKVMGAFSVRWHKDGKDGSNVWLKYAEQLDLYDTATGKSYPSRVYDSPTSNCKYLGIGKGVGAEPIGGIYYTWSKYAGDDGTSFTPKGQAVAHHASLSAYNSATKSKGLHLVDNTGGALLKYWSGSATSDRSCVDGDGYTTSDKHLWVKDGNTWNDLGEIQGPKGDNAYLDYIELKGTSYSSVGTPSATVKIKRNGVVTSRSVSSRGLTVYTINRSTLEITASRTFDTYGDTSLSSTMATYINGISDAYFVAIVSYDACGFNNNLASVLKNYGGSDIADYEIKRQAFAFLGYKGMAQGIAPQVLNIGEAKTANIVSSVIDGLCQGKGQDGATGHGWVASVDRNNQFTEAQWGTYGATGHTETWSGTSTIRNGCRIGDIFLVYGQAKDSNNGHNAFYKCTNSSGDLAGTCISHTISPKGDKGDDAYNYKLSSSVSAIPLNNDGSPNVSSITLTATIRKGSSVVSWNSSSYKIHYEIYHSGATINTDYSNSNKISISISSYKNISKIACSFKTSSGTVLDSFDILPVKAGAAGVSYFPNMCGVWDGANTTYKWTNGSRDMVTFYVGGTPYLFAVKTAGTTIKADVNNATPDKDSRWEKADSPFSMLFANFVYTDNASVGGFVFSEEQMRSISTTDGKNPEPKGSNCNILLNGNTGKFVANYATIRGEVNATSGVFKNVKITNNCRIEPETENGDGWFMRGGNDRIAAWWLGYSGKLAGQFTMNTVYDNGSNHPPTASLSFKTPNIQGGTSDGSTLISAYSNINTPLANFSHASGMAVNICPSEGTGIEFLQNSSSVTPIAFKGTGHGGLNGVIQGYKLNVMTSGLISISNGNTVYCNGNGTTLILPKLADCKNVLGTTGAFALDLTIIGASGASNFRVYGKYHNSTTDCYLLNNDHGDNWYATMSKGDVLTLKLIYTGTSFYAYVVNLQN